MTPAVVIRPILLPLFSVNQRLPSGPAVMKSGPLPPVGTGNSVTTPAGVDPPDLVAADFGEPEVAIRARRDAVRLAAGRSSELLRSRRALSLDLAAVTFVDRAGVETLERLSRAGVEIRCRPGPVASVLVVGGARTTASLIDAGLVDELGLIVYPLIAGEGKALFATTERRRGLDLRKVQQLPDGRVSLIYGIG
jgi:riboflavin biosynthesis pyrimidine reductase